MTAEELIRYADEFDAAANALTDFMEQHLLTDTERDTIEDQIEAAGKQAEMFSTDAAKLAIANASTSLANLSAATQQANQALKQIDSVERAIDIGIALVNLGAVILDPTPGKVVDAIGKLAEASAPPAVTATNS